MAKITLKDMPTVNPTLKEIADAAGVSIRSVTRALKNETGGNPDTCRRIRETAERLGYIPNIAARNLRMSRRNFIGIINNCQALTVTQRKYISLQRRLEQDGFYTISGLLPASPGKLREMILNWAGLVDTVIISAWHKDWSADETLGGIPMRFIFVDCRLTPETEKYSTILIDRSHGIQRGVEQLIMAGRRRIAYCGTAMPDRLEGFRSAFEQMGEPCAPDFFVRSENVNMEDGYRGGDILLEKGFDAAFFGTDRAALGFLKYCYERHIVVPRDIAVIGFDDDPAGEYSCPSLSSVSQPIEEISATIAELAADKDHLPVCRILPTRFVARESV